MYTNLYKRVASGTMETFSSGSGAGNGSTEAGAVVAAFITVLLFLALQLLAVQWLWNHVLTKVVTVTKPMSSMFEALGVIILFMMVVP